jgi:hypothetical protein
VEPDYLPDSEVCFSRAWIPFLDGGCVGGDSPPLLSSGGSKGGRKINGAPPGRGFGGNTPKRNFGKIFLVKYCNFIVNMDHSL